jgi:hypothetical protein
MSLFSFIETFFFISLGVTLILILLLVYHFRQRFNSLEHKCETMFELINTIVAELNTTRNSTQMGESNEENIIFHPDQMLQHTHHLENLNTINEVDHDDHGEDEESDEEESDEEESGDEESGDEDSGDEDNGDEIDINNANDDNSVKIITLENSDNGMLSELPNETNYISDNENESNNDIQELNETEPVVVEKLEIKHLENMDNEQSQYEHTDDAYHKMSLQTLKGLVITKGLCSNPSKMKKNELIKMLESTDNM